MTRTLTLTAAEWEVLQRDGTAWIVRSGARPCLNPHKEPHTHPPAELVAAAAQCDGETVTCHCGCDGPCPDCRITLVGECPTCRGRGRKWRGGAPCACEAPGCEWGTVTLGYAYADSEVQMIWRPGVPAEGTQWATLVAMLGFDPSADIGRYALKVRLA